jgi:hypothetical protein
MADNDKVCQKEKKERKRERKKDSTKMRICKKTLSFVSQ